MSITTGHVKFYGRSNDDPNRTVLVSGEIKTDGERILLFSRYNVWLKDEFKAMEGARWLGFSDDPLIKPIKAWGVKNTQRNWFQISYLLGQNPYAPYDGELPAFMPRRANTAAPPKVHQNEISAHIIHRRQCIVAGEMGVGKTLAAEEAMEASGIFDHNSIWLGPRSALDSVKYEFMRWRVCQICGKLGMHHFHETHAMRDDKAMKPRFETYESLKNIIENWPSGSPAYQCVIMDEASRVKNPTAQRSQMAKYLADSMRAEWGRKAIIALMSGTPAPREPSDWWHLCEIACPGFLREGNLKKFKDRLALIKMYEGVGGATFPKLVTWWDDERKCAECGKFANDPDHDPINMVEPWFHVFQASVNEIARLADRMKGLVLVKMKKDCLDLPEKIFRRIICKPTPSTLRAASMIMKTASSVIKGATLCRELSDGFQYREVENGTDICPDCNGSLIINRTVDLDDPDNPLDSESLTKGHRALWSDESGETIVVGYKEVPLNLGVKAVECTLCKGTGRVPHYDRESVRVDCPKDDAVFNLLDQYEEEGRFVLWAGFTDSVERCCSLCLKAGWPVVRLDGRGWWSNLANLNGAAGPTILQAFDDKQAYPKLVFVGQPGAGGMGLNLTASSAACYYSNTHKGEDRGQSVDRIHRIGADHNRGCTIYDLIHLPQDLAVLESLNRKCDLQAMTMGQFAKMTEQFEEEIRTV